MARGKESLEASVARAEGVRRGEITTGVGAQIKQGLVSFGDFGLSMSPFEP